MLLMLIVVAPNLAQKNNDTTKVITIARSEIRDCQLGNRFIWILRDDGVLLKIDRDNHQRIDSLRLQQKIQAIGLSKRDTLWAADERGNLFKVFDQLDTSLVLPDTRQHVLHILFNSANEPFLVTDKGIFEPIYTKRLYYKNAFSNIFLSRANSREWRPTAVYMSRENDIWLGFSAGEWGGDIVIFSAKNDFIDRRRYTMFRPKGSNRCPVQPVRSFFEIDSSMYVSTSLQHMMIRSLLLRVEKDSCAYVFTSPSDRNFFENTIDSQSLYIGPALYNPDDQCIYFYCQLGIFKGSVKKDLSQVSNWQKVIETNFLWNYGQPDAVGYAMNVTRMSINKNVLMVLSPQNGVLLINGDKRTYFKCQTPKK